MKGTKPTETRPSFINRTHANATNLPNSVPELGDHDCNVGILWQVHGWIGMVT